MLQRLVGQTESASNESWKSLIDEDRLLTRVEILESQLSTYGKSMNEDKLREETKRLMEEKEEYQVNTLVIRAFKMVTKVMPCPFTGPKMFWAGKKFCARPKIYLHIVAVTNILCQTKR